MSFDTYLVVFHHFDAHSLQKLEIKYIGTISALTGIPAIVFLFIRTPSRGPIYGGETVSLKYSLKISFLLASLTNSSGRFGALYLPTGCSFALYFTTYLYGMCNWSATFFKQ